MPARHSLLASPCHVNLRMSLLCVVVEVQICADMLLCHAAKTDPVQYAKLLIEELKEHDQDIDLELARLQQLGNEP